MDRDERLIQEVVIRQRIQRSSASQLELISSSEKSSSSAFSSASTKLAKLAIYIGYKFLNYRERHDENEGRARNDWFEQNWKVSMVSLKIHCQIRCRRKSTIADVYDDVEGYDDVDDDDNTTRWRWQRLDDSNGNNYDNTNLHGGGIVQALRAISGKTVLRGLNIYLAVSHPWPRVTEQTHLFSSISLIS